MFYIFFCLQKNEAFKSGFLKKFLLTKKCWLIKDPKEEEKMLFAIICSHFPLFPFFLRHFQQYPAIYSRFQSFLVMSSRVCIFDIYLPYQILALVTIYKVTAKKENQWKILHGQLFEVII